MKETNATSSKWDFADAVYILNVWDSKCSDKIKYKHIEKRFYLS